jgi:hypothetical protein
MKSVCKFLLLSPADQFLLVRSWLVLGMIRLGLWLLPFQTLRRLLAGMTRMNGSARPLRQENRTSPGKVAWAVEAASKYVPAARTCLTRALAVQAILQSQGYPAFLRIGVVRGTGGDLEGHAWVESEGKIVIGEKEHLSYVPLATMKGDSP